MVDEALVQITQTGAVRTLTLNRPKALNSFTAPMHRRCALRSMPRPPTRRCAACADRRRPRLLRRAGSGRPSVAPNSAGRATDRHRRRDRALLQAARAAASARCRCRSSPRSTAWRPGAGREHRARLRHRDRDALGQLHPGLLEDRPGAGLPAAPGCCRASSAVPRRSAWRCSATSCRPRTRAHGPDLEVRRRRRLCRRRAGASRASGRAADARARRHAARDRCVAAPRLRGGAQPRRRGAARLGASHDYLEGVAAFMAQAPAPFKDR